MSDVKTIEHTIIKTYRKEIWAMFIKALKEYELVKDNDKIMVCISGGKDSFLMAKCFQELHRHGKIKFDLKFVVMNPGYNKKNLDLIKKNAKLLNLDIDIFNSDIFEVANKLNPENPCYMCARMRRGHLYNYAQKIGCNKIALGHHFDDVVETILLSMFYGSEIKTMLPKVRSTNFSGLELIRPLYLVKESSIINWVNKNELTFLNCACKFTDELEEDKSKRLEIKKLIANLRKTNPNIDMNLFKSIGNVNLDAVLGYRKDTKKYFFLDEYDKK